MWNRGLATETVREILGFGFEAMNLNRVEARCKPVNTASARVLASQLHGVPVSEPSAWLLAPCAALAAAALASIAPALRAARTPPGIALRAE